MSVKIIIHIPTLSLGEMMPISKDRMHLNAVGGSKSVLSLVPADKCGAAKSLLCFMSKHYYAHRKIFLLTVPH